MMIHPVKHNLKRSIRKLLLVFITGLIISGLTAFPIEAQLTLMHQWKVDLGLDAAIFNWMDIVYNGVKETNEQYPFIAYGTDWLAFAHLIIALIFIGPFKDPVKNIWIVEWGMIACVAIFPLACIAGMIRGIPFYWRFIDCSFGIVGGVLLWICHRKIKVLESLLPDIDR